MADDVSKAGAESHDNKPDSINITHVTETDCPRCDTEGECEHLVIMWGGNGYDRGKTWIAAPDENTVTLSEME